MQIGFIVSLIFAIIIAVFALKNGNDVSVDFIFTKMVVSQAIVIFVSAALGAIIVTLLGLVRQIKMSLKIRDMSKKITVLEDEKKALEDKISIESDNEKSLNDLETENEVLEEIKYENEKSEKINNEDNNSNIDEEK